MEIPIHGTHFPILAAAVHGTSGPVLEFGASDFSTPLLHFMCQWTARRLVTVESRPNWLTRFEDLRADWHTLHHVEPGKEDEFKLVDEIHWGVVFMDHALAERRVKEIERFRKRATFIVVHDTEASIYGYESVLRTFRYRFDWRRWIPHTSVVSMERPFRML